MAEFQALDEEVADEARCLNPEYSEAWDSTPARPRSAEEGRVTRWPELPVPLELEEKGYGWIDNETAVPASA